VKNWLLENRFTLLGFVMGMSFFRAFTQLDPYWFSAAGLLSLYLCLDYIAMCKRNKQTYAA